MADTPNQIFPVKIPGASPFGWSEEKKEKELAKKLRRSGSHRNSRGRLGGGGGPPVPTVVLSATSIAEDAADNSVVGTLSVSNGSGVYTYAIAIGGDPDNKFAIVGDELQIDELLDYETATSHLVTIEADNGVDDPISRQFTITVTNVADSPGDISGLIAWWKADAGLFQNSNGTTAASSNNDPVGYWGDSVGTRHIIEATAGERPLLQTALPSVKFDGTDDRLAYAGAFTDVVGSVVVAFKTQATSFSAARVLLSSADEAAADVWFEIGIATDGRLYFESNAAGTKHTVFGSSYLELDTSYLLALTHDGTDFYMQLSGVEQNPLTITSLGTPAWFGDVAGADNIVMGGTVTSAGLVRPFLGEIMEVAVYSGDIT